MAKQTSMRFSSPTKQKTLLSLGLVLHCAFVGCVSPRERSRTNSELLSAVDTELHFSLTGLPNVHTVEFAVTRDARITQVDEDWERLWFKKRTSTRCLTRKGWQQFLGTLARLDIHRWKPMYSPSERISDGYHWNFRISDGRRTLKSRGANAGPSPLNPKKTVTILDENKISADTILSRALRDLWKHSSL